MSQKIRVFYFCMMLYAATTVIALSSTKQHLINPFLTSLVHPVQITVESGLIFIGVFVVFTYVMVRFAHAARSSLSLFLAIALIAGAQFILSAWMSGSWSIAVAVCLALVLQLTPLVITHDISVMLGIAGISGILGLSMTPQIASGLLAVLSVYDVISVYRTRHMVALAHRMQESGAVFGFLIPSSFSGFMSRRQDALQSRSVMMLGSGDIGLPLVLAASAVSQSMNAALVVSVFSLGGVAIMQWLFANQKESAPMAALPPIALSAILGYVCALVLGI